MGYRFQPLTNHWEAYQAKLNEANEEGLLDDPLDAQQVIYPDQLYLGEGEKDDIRTFVTDRLNELYGQYQATGGGFDPDYIGTYLFRGVILGMIWERERIGR